MSVKDAFTFRMAEPEDLAILADLEADTFGVASWGADGVRTAFTGEGVAGLIADDASGAPAGFCLWRMAADEAEILSIGVVSSRRRQGMARALLQRMAAKAADYGVEALFLEVNAGNEAAIALYEKAGFCGVGARKAYYRDGADALIMRRDLNSPR